MLKFFILGWLFLIGLNSLTDFFIEDKWILKNNKNYAIYLSGIVLLDIAGIYLFYFLMPTYWILPNV